jgi:hypothetical protein
MRSLFFLTILLSFLSPIIKAQDTIVKRNGDKVIVKLMEVKPSEVLYKRLDYLDGPLFTLQKQDIQFIGYANGVRESFDDYVSPPVYKGGYPPLDLSIQTTGKYYYYKERRISEPDMISIAEKLNDPKINLMIKKVEEKKFIQNATMIGSAALFVAGLYTYESNLPKRSRKGTPPATTPSNLQGQANGEYLMLAALGCGIASVYFRFDRKKHAHILVNAYNKELSLR